MKKGVVDLRQAAISAGVIVAMLVVLVLFGCAGDPLTRDEAQARAGYGEVRGGLPSPSAERQHRQQGN